jgi:hypothetical protein
MPWKLKRVETMLSAADWRELQVRSTMHIVRDWVGDKISLDGGNGEGETDVWSTRKRVERSEAEGGELSMAKVSVSRA